MAKNTSSPVASSSGEEMMGKFPKYKVESATRTIMDAHQHMADPELMAQVKKHAAGQQAGLNAIHGAAGDDGDGDEDAVQAQASFKKKPSISGMKAVYAKKFGAKGNG